MAINKISQEKINQIKQKTVITLPNQPKISAEELKARFVKPIVDTSNSMIQELDRIVEETNAELDGIDDTLQDLESRIGELELFADNLETNITEEIEDALENKADLVDGKVPLEQLPDVEDVLTGDITSHNHATEIGNHNSSETAHTDIRNAVAEAKAIAEGKVSAMSFETKEDLDAWLLIPENVETLIVGTNFYIEDLASPDYWWNGTTIKELETQKVDLTEYAKSDDLATVATTGSYNDLTNTPTIPTVPTISTNITTDATSDAKTASPKAVKTYVDNAISTALDNLLGGEY